MESRIKRLFFGRRSSSTLPLGNPNLKGTSYDSAIALDPPLRGSYPVAGNGPNVLDEIQRSKSKQDAVQRESTTSNTAIPRRPGATIERPRTAPSKVRREESFTSGTKKDRRTFSVRSPPSLFSSSRRNSVRSTIDAPPPPIPTQVPLHTHVSRTSTPKPQEIKTYEPRRGAADPVEAGIVIPFTPPFAQHQRGSSVHSHKSHVDLLDAHSSINSSRDLSKNRAKASGVRNYGEDVADRNIATYEPQLDLNTPDLSYLKSLYRSKNNVVAVTVPRDGVLHHGPSPSDFDLGYGEMPSDDIQHSRSQMKANSTRTAQNPSSRASLNCPSWTDSTSALALHNSRDCDDARFALSNGIRDHRTRALSPYSTSASIHEEPEEGQQVFEFPVTSTPPIPPRGRARPTPSDGRIVSFSSGFTDSTSRQPLSGTGTPPLKSSLKQRGRTMSETSQASAASGGTRSRNGSVSFSIFPNTSRQDYPPKQQPHTRGTSDANSSKNSGFIADGAKEPPNLNGVVDLTNSVDTDVTTQMLPAVAREKIIPTRHEIREEQITREIHTHDILHRVLPVLETEILPPKHYVSSRDVKGLREVPEHIISGRTANRRQPGRESIEAAVNGKDNVSPTHRNMPFTQSRNRTQSLTRNEVPYPHPIINEEDSADTPIVAFYRGEQKANQKATRSRASSQTSMSAKANSLTSIITSKTGKSKPLLASKKEHVAKESYPRTKYTWHHQPAGPETSSAMSQPRYVEAGKGDLNSPVISNSDEEDSDAAELGAMKGEEGLLFRDDEYGRVTLPGLVDSAPAGRGFLPEDFEVIRLGKVVGEESEKEPGEGEATKALSRIGKRSGSDNFSRGKGLESGMKSLKI